MKRTIIILMLLPLLAACIAEHSEVTPVTAERLESYSTEVMAETVAIPVEAVEFAIDFDAYLKLSDLEKEADYRFFGNCREDSTGVYSISYDSSREFRVVNMRVDTRGRSIMEEGASWKILEFSVYGNDFDYSYLDYSLTLPEDSEMIMMTAADSTWAVSMGDRGAAMMKMHPKRGELYEWTVEAHGTEETSIGMHADFSTVGPFTVRERYLESKEKTNVYEGYFNVDIFRQGVPHDYCHMTFAPGKETIVKTSR